jgi:hypothetical protein
MEGLTLEEEEMQCNSYQRMPITLHQHIESVSLAVYQARG